MIPHSFHWDPVFFSFFLCFFFGGVGLELMASDISTLLLLSVSDVNISPPSALLFALRHEMNAVYGFSHLASVETKELEYVANAQIVSLAVVFWCIVVPEKTQIATGGASGGKDAGASMQYISITSSWRSSKEHIQQVLQRIYYPLATDPMLVCLLPFVFCIIKVGFGQVPLLQQKCLQKKEGIHNRTQEEQQFEQQGKSS